MKTPPPIHPNVLTAARLPMAPIAVGFMATQTTWGYVTAAALALILEITDIADGQIARRYGSVTPFGKLFDPFSDAFCRFTLFLGLFSIGVADLWMIIVICFRDSSISFMRSVAAVRNVVVAARPSGKLKAIVQGVGTQIIFLALVLFVLAPELPIPPELPWWTMLIITIVTFGSFIDYFIGNLPILRAAWHEESQGPSGSEP
ncbi:MAG TPA: CDP-alcohol phosphatidyltransferase family protein [Deltaproteobacteria bacterium]|nr:CDP-alcohol phosphatidyltransferase family protein [Deltaproteobacteria bacterium]